MKSPPQLLLVLSAEDQYEEIAELTVRRDCTFMMANFGTQDRLFLANTHSASHWLTLTPMRALSLLTGIKRAEDGSYAIV